MKIVKIRIIRSFATFALRRCTVEKKRIFRETCTEPVEVSVYKRVLITPIPNEPKFIRHPFDTPFGRRAGLREFALILHGLSAFAQISE
ncbi:MAG: hypothetical protein ACOYYJ_07490, partial [Chloroflexota bacterium]